MVITDKYLRKVLTLAYLMLSLSVSAYTDHRNAKVDSAEQVLRQRKDLTDRERMDCYYTIVRGTLGKDSEKHERYCREMLAQTYRINALNMRENALYHLGLQNYGKEQYDAAERYFLWALAVTDSMRGDKRYKESDIDDNLSQLYGALGNLYNMQDKALLAIEYYQKALPIFEKHSWLESQTILHHNVAELWLTMGNNEKAEQEYLKAIETGEASGDSLLMALPRKGLVKIYISEDDYDKALQTVMPAYQYYKSHRAEEVGDYPEVLASMVKIHLISGHKDLAKARSYAVEALSLDSDELIFETHADINAAAALVAIDENKWEEALRYALKSVHENDDEATYSDVSCYDMIAQIYVELGDKANARVYINKVVRMMERFATENYQSALSQMEVLYETEKKEEQIALMNRAQVYYNWSLIAAAVLIVMLIVVLVYRHLAHRRQKALLAAKVALETETKERRILARDLHDSLGGMLSLLRLKMEEYKQKIGQSDQPDEVLPLLDATHTELRRVSHHLMPEELLRNGLVSALHDFAISVPMTRFQAVGDIRLDKDRELVLYRCAYEMVNNAVKHADASRIDIQLIEDEKSIVLTVSDDGKGMTEGNSSGMGLQNIRERIEPFSGEMRVITSENDGTEINIILPL